MANPQPWTGIIPATFLPLQEDYQIDGDELRRLLGFLKSVPGVTGLTCNGRAGDVFSLSREEQRRVIEIHVDEAQGKINVVAGIKAEATWKVIELMQDARDAGANAVLVDFHPRPEDALCDGPQALLFDELPRFIEDAKIVRDAYQARLRLLAKPPSEP